MNMKILTDTNSHTQDEKQERNDSEEDLKEEMELEEDSSETVTEDLANGRKDKPKQGMNKGFKEDIDPEDEQWGDIKYMKNIWDKVIYLNSYL